jgi:membrane associated rhomboid family serine protease
MRSRSPFSPTPWVRGLIAANAVVYLLTITVFTGPWFVELFAFSPAQAWSQWWGAFTYMFLHGGFLHLAFNMLMLFFFGPAVEERMGGGTFALYYLVCGIGGPVFSYAVSLFAPVAPFVGASAAVFGVSLAFAMYWPNAPIYVFPIPTPIPAKWLVAFLATLDLVSAILAANDGVAHLAHLGGFLFGFIYVKGEERVARRAQTAMARRPVRRPRARTLARETAAREGAAPGPSRSAIPNDAVDRVLDKISATGLDSLTPEERRLLVDASRELRSR